MRIYNWYRKADIFARVVGFNIGGLERYKTGTGATLSLIYVAFLLVITFQQFADYFDTTDPQTTVEGYSTDRYPKVDLVKSSMLPFFIGAATETDYTPAEDISYFVSLDATRISWITTLMPDESVIIDKISKVYNFVPCRSLSDQEKVGFSYALKDVIFKEIFEGYGLCPKVGESITIEGKGIDILMDEFLINVKPCTALKKDSCASLREVERFNFQIVTPSSNFNASNFKNPHYKIPNADALLYISTKTKQITTIQLIENQIYDYVGINANWKHTSTYFEAGAPYVNIMNREEDKIFCTIEEAYGPEGSGCTSYFTLDIMSSGQVIRRKRAYPTLSETLGVIGGATGIISLAISFVYSFINRRKRNKFILKTIYPMIIAEELMTTKVVRRKFPFCCFKKREKLSLNDPNYPDIQAKIDLSQEEALERIRESMDLVSIVRNSSYMNVLSDMTFRDRHKGLSPVLDVNLWKKAKDSPNDEDSSFNSDEDFLQQPPPPVTKPDSQPQPATSTTKNKDQPISKLQRYKLVIENTNGWMKDIKAIHNRRSGLFVCSPGVVSPTSNRNLSFVQAPKHSLLKNLYVAADEYYHKELYPNDRKTPNQPEAPKNEERTLWITKHEMPEPSKENTSNNNIESHISNFEIHPASFNDHELQDSKDLRECPPSMSLKARPEDKLPYILTNSKRGSSHSSNLLHEDLSKSRIEVERNHNEIKNTKKPTPVKKWPLPSVRVSTFAPH